MINFKHNPALGLIELQVPVIGDNFDFDETIVTQNVEADEGAGGGAEERGGSYKESSGGIWGCSEVKEGGG